MVRYINRSGSGYPSGRRMTPFTIEKIAVLAPMPSASVSTATVVKPGSPQHAQPVAHVTRHIVEPGCSATPLALIHVVPGLLQFAANAGSAPPRLSRLRVHHAGAQPPFERLQIADRLQLREPRPRQGRGLLPAVPGRGELRGLRRGDRRSAHRRGGRGRAADVSSRPDAARAARGQARAGREAGVSAHRGLPRGDRRAQPGEARGARRRERSLQAARGRAADS